MSNLRHSLYCGNKNHFKDCESGDKSPFSNFELILMITVDCFYQNKCIYLGVRIQFWNGIDIHIIYKYC